MVRATQKLPDPIATLRNEHRYMTLLLNTVLQRLNGNGLTSSSDYFLVQDIVRYMHEYPDVVHHPTEDVLFDRLVIREPASKKDVQRLRRDHERLEGSTAELMELLDVASTKQTKAASDAARTAIKRYIGRLQKHMQFEESVLFPKAIACLAHDDWKAVGTRQDEIEDPLFGQRVGRDYRALYEFISNRSENMSRNFTKSGFLQFDSMIMSADAFEHGVSEMWELLSRHANQILTETRSAAKQITNHPGPGLVICTPFRFARFLGTQTLSFGSDAANIYVKTARQVALPFFQGKFTGN